MITLYRRIVTPLGRISDLLLLLVRVTVGFLFIDHGLQKYTGKGGLASFQYFLQSLGNVPSPALTSRVVPFVEVAAGVLLLLGVLTRIFAAVLAIEMVVTGFLVKMHDLHVAVVSQTMAGVELDIVYLVVLLTIFVLGPGRLSVDAAAGLDRPSVRPVPERSTAYSAS